LKLFLDTANIDHIREINSWGVLGGVTTNPTLCAKEGKEFYTSIKEICAEVDGPVSAEAISLETEEIIKEARHLASLAPNVVVKVPIAAKGLAAVRRLTDEGVKTNMTLCFSANQAILAARAGATYVSPFLGRMDDMGNPGMDLLEEICEVYAVQGYECEIIAASLRSPQQVSASARIGADVATIPYDVFKKMVAHPLTDSGIRRFTQDWESYQRATGAI
jgi:transaldolase